MTGDWRPGPGCCCQEAGGPLVPRCVPVCCVCNCTLRSSSLSLDHVRYLLPISRPKPPAAASIPPLKVAPGVTRERGQGRRHYMLPSVCSTNFWNVEQPYAISLPFCLSSQDHLLPPPSLGNMCHLCHPPVQCSVAHICWTPSLRQLAENPPLQRFTSY